MDKVKMRALALALLAGTALSAATAYVQAQTTPAAPAPETKILPEGQASGGAEAEGEAAQPKDMGAASAPEAEGSEAAPSGTADAPAADTTDAPAADTADAPAAEESETDTAAQPTAEDGDDASTAAAPETGDAEEEQAASEDAPSAETTGSIDISAEQKTEIQSVFVENKVEPVDIDVEVSVGVSVPKTVTLHPLPPRIIEIVPAYQGYEYFVLADGRIVIVKPATYEVVYILVV